MVHKYVQHSTYIYIPKIVRNVYMLHIYLTKGTLALRAKDRCGEKGWGFRGLWRGGKLAKATHLHREHMYVRSTVFRLYIITSHCGMPSVFQLIPLKWCLHGFHFSWSLCVVLLPCFLFFCTFMVILAKVFNWYWTHYVKIWMFVGWNLFNTFDWEELWSVFSIRCKLNASRHEIDTENSRWFL